MKGRPKPYPVMLAELALASWQTIAYRMSMMALGTCTAAEYRRMTTEKIVAAQRSVLAAMLPLGNRETAISPRQPRRPAALCRVVDRRLSRRWHPSGRRPNSSLTFADKKVMLPGGTKEGLKMLPEFHYAPG